jgi:hypothetical protein
MSEGQELPPIPADFEQFTPRTARALVRGATAASATCRRPVMPNSWRCATSGYSASPKCGLCDSNDDVAPCAERRGSPVVNMFLFSATGADGPGSAA